MKKLLRHLLVFLIIGSLYSFLGGRDVRAETRNLNCRLSAWAEFDNNYDVNGAKIAVVRSDGGSFSFVFDDFDINVDEYKGYIYLGEWKEAVLNKSVGFMGRTTSYLTLNTTDYPESGKYKVGAYILKKDRSEKGFYCDGEVWVYNEEGFRTKGDWVNSIRKVYSFENFVSPAIYSESGREIGGAKINGLDVFNKYTVNNEAGDLIDKGYWTFGLIKLPYSINYIVEGYALSGGGNRKAINFEMVPDKRNDPNNCEGVCWVEGKLGVGRLTLYTIDDSAVVRPKTIPAFDDNKSSCYKKNGVRYCCSEVNGKRKCWIISVPPPRDYVPLNEKRAVRLESYLGRLDRYVRSGKKISEGMVNRLVDKVGVLVK